MIVEWIRFGVSAAFTLLGVLAFLSAAFGVGRFGFCLNRLHAAAIADTVGVSCIVFSAIVYIGIDFVSLKELCVLVLMTLTSPVSTHLLAQLEYAVSDSVTENVTELDSEETKGDVEDGND